MKLTIKGTRVGGFAEPLNLVIENLPAGVTASGPVVLAANQGEVSVELQCAADARTSAALATVRSTMPVNADGGQAAFPLAVSITMKPRVKVSPEGLDDVRKWPRGTTYLAPVLLERLEGFSGDVMLEQTAHQQRVRQGITGPDWLVPAGITRTEYPVFMPEWLETTKTSRIILNGVVRVADPSGRERQLLQKMELRIGMLPVGALMKIAYSGPELTASPGARWDLPVAITRADELTEPLRLEVIVPPELTGAFTSSPVEVPAVNTTASVALAHVGNPPPPGDHTLTIRGTVLREGKWKVLAETTVELSCP